MRPNPTLAQRAECDANRYFPSLQSGNSLDPSPFKGEVRRGMGISLSVWVAIGLESKKKNPSPLRELVLPLTGGFDRNPPLFNHLFGQP